MRKLFSLTTLVVVFALSFFAATVFLNAPGEQPIYAGSAATIFSILFGFMVADGRSRMNNVYQRLKTENANNLTVYRLSSVFGSDVQGNVRQLLDSYLIAQVDYEIEDFDRSDRAFQRLYQYIISLDPKNDREKTAYTRLITLLHESTTNRAQIEAVVKDRLRRGQWLSILALMGVTITTIWSMADGGILAGGILTALASGIVLMVLIMRDMDNLKWGNASWTWQPLHDLFKDLSLIPYYPSEVLKGNEAKIKKGETIRVAYTPNKYPNMKGKVIKTFVVGDAGLEPATNRL